MIAIILEKRERERDIAGRPLFSPQAIKSHLLQSLTFCCCPNGYILLQASWTFGILGHRTSCVAVCALGKGHWTMRLEGICVLRCYQDSFRVTRCHLNGFSRLTFSDGIEKRRQRRHGYTWRPVCKRGSNVRSSRRIVLNIIGTRSSRFPSYSPDKSGCCVISEYI